MRIALDATYSVDPRPSGIAIYSKRLLSGLGEAYSDTWVHCYRPKQFLRSRPCPRAVRRPLIPPVPTFRADVFHALNQRVDKRPTKRVISTFHDLFVMTGEYSSREFRTRFTAQARLAAERSDLIISVSEFTASQIRELLNVEASRIRVVHHGVDVPQKTDESDRENIILFVGALQLRKNVLRLIEAFEQLELPEWRLVLAGSPSGYQGEEIVARVAASPRRDSILLTGYISDQEMNRWFRKASVFAFPSLDEGFGMPVLQAMAYGVPVLCSNRSALPEVAGDAALLVDPKSVEEIRAGLKRIMTDSALKNDLERRGRERAAGFSWRNTVDAVYRAYEELL